nr:MAG TPA: tail protein [Caudoviricetes sp.]
MTILPPLLPKDSGVFERALEQVILPRILNADVDALRRMRDPYLCSVAHLPFLAWGKGVDLWYDSWPEWKKRRITSEIYQMKGLKGTLPGIEKYLSYVDATVVESILPPQGVVMRSEDPARLRLWRERFAELRLYPYRVRDRRPGYVVSGQGKPTLWNVGHGVVLPNLSHLYYGRRAVIVDKGIETVVRSFDQVKSGGSDVAVTTTTFAISTVGRSYDATLRRGVIGHMAVHAKTRGRLIVISDAGSIGGASIPAGFEGVKPLDMAPERVFQNHRGRFHEPAFAPASRAIVGSMVAYASQASRYIYDSWRLMDSDRTGSDSHQVIGSAVGWMMVGLTPYHAFLRINARFKSSGRPATVNMWGVGLMTVAKTSDRISQVGAAIYRARALRDTVKFTTKTYRPRTVADLSFDHSVSFGGMVPINRRS